MNELFPDFSVNLYFLSSLVLSFLRARWVNSINQVIVLRLQYTNSQVLGAMRPRFGPVYKCLFSMAPDEAKPTGTVSFSKDQWIWGQHRILLGLYGLHTLFSLIILMIL